MFSQHYAATTMLHYEEEDFNITGGRFDRSRYGFIMANVLITSITLRVNLKSFSTEED